MSTEPCIQIDRELAVIDGHSYQRSEIASIEVKPAESTARNLWFFLSGCLAPIAAMFVFTLLSGPAMWGIGLLCAAGPFIAIATSFAWKKPWGVVVECPDRYRTVFQSGDRAAAEAAEQRARGLLGLG